MDPFRKKLIIQSIGELVIPLLGYFSWSWSYFDILLFYFLDLLASLVLLFVKFRKIDRARHEQATPQGTFVLKLILLLAGICFLVLSLMKQEVEHFDLGQAVWNFMMLEDMGLPQGFFLVPLIVLTAYLSYRTDFIQPRFFLVAEIPILQRKSLRSLLLVIAFFAIIYGLSTWILLEEVLLVLLTVIAFTAYRFYDEMRFQRPM
ncbi:MAG: hypothetical protein EP338_01955 [Bacteroidetes bacterium]|nr:MAG: hypothetical protein EP338_01955 [Bacteroidota bacterium]